MKYQLTYLFLLANLFATTVLGQTVIKIPFTQNEVFIVEPRETILSYVSGESIVIGGEIEIHGGSGQYVFTWTKDGNVISEEPTITVNEAGDYQLSVDDGQSCEAVSLFRVGTSSAISNSDEIIVQLYPNPATREFNLSFQSGRKPETIELFSIDGVLQETSITPDMDSNIYKVDISELQTGYYLVVSNFKSYKLTKVLLKQN